MPEAGLDRVPMTKGVFAAVKNIGVAKYGSPQHLHGVYTHMVTLVVGNTTVSVWLILLEKWILRRDDSSGEEQCQK